MYTLETYGWTKERAQDWAAAEHPTTLIPARIVADHGQYFKVVAPHELSARIVGSMMHKRKTVEMPKIGDWVAIEAIDENSAVIHTVLPRTSEIVRGHVGRLLDKQVIAANVDLAFIVQPLDHDFSPARLERYIFQLTSQNITPVILLNKTDKADGLEAKKAALSELVVDVISISALKDADISEVERYVSPEKTIVILGSSGAGKSTLTNRLLGQTIQATAPIREKDSKGRHTTVHRELFVLPRGGMVIDTPGVRELQLWGDETDLELLFPEIFTTARHCRYSNCAHDTEDGCAIKASIAGGEIDPKRYRIFCNFKQELKTIQQRREFITHRQSEQTRESSLRRMKRRRRYEQDNGTHFE